MRHVEQCDALLVAGTSAHVLSAFRFLSAAERRGVPICIINAGECRGDALRSVSLRLHALTDDALASLTAIDVNDDADSLDRRRVEPLNSAV